MGRQDPASLPSVTASQMREVDRLMVDDLGIGLLQMMEHAGRGLTEVGRTLLGGELNEKQVLVLVGPGHNGAGGLVAARLFANGGARVTVVLAQLADRLKGMPAQQYRVLARIGIPSRAFDADPGELADLLGASDLVVDALLGYSLEGPPRGPIATLIQRANENARQILALDLPSGLHPDTGHVSGSCIRARATVTLALPKRGLLEPAAHPYVGDLWLADIGVPMALYPRLGFVVGPVFSPASVIRRDEWTATVP